MCHFHRCTYHIFTRFHPFHQNFNVVYGPRKRPITFLKDILHICFARYSTVVFAYISMNSLCVLLEVLKTACYLELILTRNYAEPPIIVSSSNHIRVHVFS